MNNSNKIKICFIAPKAYPLFNPDVENVTCLYGGSEVDEYLLAMELAKDKNFIVSFVVADYGQAKSEIIDNVRIIKSLYFEENHLSSTIKVWRAMQAANAEIYFQEVASLGTFLVVLYCKLQNKMFLYRTANLHECDGTYLEQHYVAGKAFSWSLRNSAQVIVQNEADKKKIEETLGVSSIPIPNGDYLPKLTKCKKDFILWVGRSVKTKRPELFIKLAKTYTNENFVMICPQALGDDNYDELVNSAGQVSNLTFINQVPFNEIDSFFQRAKLFVCTSKAEGFPNTYVQACKHSTAILSLCVNPDNFLNRYACGVCTNDNWDEFIQQFEWLLLNTEVLQEYSKNARKYAGQRHDIKKITKIYKNLFLKLRANVR